MSVILSSTDVVAATAGTIICPLTHKHTHTGRIISMAVMLEADKHPEAGESEKDGTGGLRLSLLNPADGQGPKRDQK